MSAAEKEVATEIESSDRSVRDEIMASMKEVEAAQEEAAPEEKPSKARDETGKFAKTEEPERAQPEESVVAESTAAAVPTQTAPFVAAPSSWSNAAKAKWGALDPDLRAEIAKREADVHKGFTKMDDERNFAKEMQRIVSPYEAVIRAAGTSVPQAVQSVLNTAYILRTADPNTKANAIAQVCREYGVDLSLLSQPQSIDPNLSAMQQRVAQLEGQLQQQTRAQQEASQNEVQSAIQAFGQDPKHPHFNDVQVHMGALMQAGEAKSMEEAYDMAVWARPDLRAQQLAAQQAQLKEKSAEKARQARARSVSVRGGPGGSMPQATNPNSSVREDLEAAFREASGRI